MLKRNPGKALFQMMLARRLVPSLIVILAFFIFFAVLLQLTTDHNNALKQERQTERLAQSLLDVEESLRGIDYAQWNIINSRIFSQFAYMYDDLDWYTRYDLQEEIKQSLAGLRNAHAFVKSAWLYLPGLNKVISDTRTNAAKPDWLFLFSKDEVGVLRVQDGLLVHAVVRTEMDDDAEELATLVVVLDEERILERLEYALMNETDRILLDWGSEGQLVAQKGLISHSQLSQPVVTVDGREYANLVVKGNQFSVRAHYLSDNRGGDDFAQMVVLLMAIFVGCVLLVEAVSLFVWYRQVYLPLHELLIEAFGRVEAGDLQYRISIDERSPFASMYDSYNHMMQQMEEYVENNLKQQLLVSRANLKQLQSQINPHFMYNSYYVLYRLIKKGDLPSSLQLAEHLGQFYHYITRNADDEKRLDQEVEHAKTYAAIQKFRFRDALDIAIDTPGEEIAKVYVPRLILQPLLENAFQYAYETDTGGGVMKLCVRYERISDHCFDIIAENSGDVMEATLDEIRTRLACVDETLETTALVNINRRLQIYFGRASHLGVERSPLGGLLVRMHIDIGEE